MVSKASEDLPDPDSPVMTTSALRGIATEMSRRLCSRAPETTICSAEDITPLECREANGCSPQRKAATSGISGTSSRSGAGERDQAAAAGDVDPAAALARRAERRGAADAGAEGHAARAGAQADELAAVEVHRPDDPAGDDRRAGLEAGAAPRHRQAAGAHPDRDHPVHARYVDLPPRIGQPAERPGAQLARGEGMADPAEVGGVEQVGDALLADRERPAPGEQGRAHGAEVGVRAGEARG